MNILIEKSRYLKTIQQEFQLMFPQLKIEFYKNKNTELNGHWDILDCHLTISELLPQAIEGTLEIVPVMTVSELEQQFEMQFGLHVQVFRKSGNVWLQTGRTDSWTLGQQNQEAIDMNKPLSSPEPEDYREQE